MKWAHIYFNAALISFIVAAIYCSCHMFISALALSLVAIFWALMGIGAFLQIIATKLTRIGG